MTDIMIESELSSCMGRLPTDQKRRVLEFARSLSTGPVKGTPGSALLRFAGKIDESDLDSMAEAIEDGCERVDAGEW